MMWKFNFYVPVPKVLLTFFAVSTNADTLLVRVPL